MKDEQEKREIINEKETVRDYQDQEEGARN